MLVGRLLGRLKIQRFKIYSAVNQKHANRIITDTYKHYKNITNDDSYSSVINHHILDIYQNVIQENICSKRISFCIKYQNCT